MEEYEKYNYLRMDITLNRMGYGYEDMQDLFDEPFDTLYQTKIGFEWFPSVTGHNLIDLQLIFNYVLTGAATVIIGKITSDLYDWTKNSLSKVLNKKNDFEESRVTLIFNDVTVTIFTFEKDDILKTLKNMDIVIEHLKGKNITNRNINLDSEELKALKSKMKD